MITTTELQNYGTVTDRLRALVSLKAGWGILLNLHILSVTSVKWRNLSFAFIESKWEVANRKKPLKL